MSQTDAEVAEIVARFRTPPGMNWEPLRDDIVTLLASRQNQDGEIQLLREAMQGATDAMLKAGSGAIGGYDTKMDTYRAGDIWQAMIDAALSPTTSSVPPISPPRNAG